MGFENDRCGIGTPECFKYLVWTREGAGRIIPVTDLYTRKTIMGIAW
jgi:hypothetical protein